MKLPARALMVLALGCAGPALAQQASYPRLSSETTLELQGDDIVHTSNGEGKTKNLHGKAEEEANLFLTQNFGIKATLTLEQVVSQDRDSAFRDHALYLEQLFGFYKTSDFSFFAGKFNAPFGQAWDTAPGIYGQEFAGDYELTERVGFGASMNFGNDRIGHHTVTGTLFTADTSFLSTSLITKPRFGAPGVDRVGRNRLAYGGQGNTGQLDNGTVTMKGFGIAGIEGLSYNIGYEHLSPGDAGAKATDGVVAGLIYDHELSDRWAMKLGLEGVYQTHASGTASNATYITPSAEFTLDDKWLFSAAGTWRSFSKGADGTGSRQNDYLVDATVGYRFTDQLAGYAALARMREEGVSSDYVGLLLRYHLNIY